MQGKGKALLIPFLHIELVFLEVFWCRGKKFAGFLGNFSSLLACPSSQSGGLVSLKGVVEGCGRETLKIPTSVT